MQNPWSIRSVELVTTQNYLDQLQEIYPQSEGERNTAADVLDRIRESFEARDDNALINRLLDLEKFPTKDSYVGFLRRDRGSIERNPETVDRICNQLYEIGIENVIGGIMQPMEGNRRRGNQFSQWVRDNFDVVGENEFQRSTEGVVVLGATEREALDFCNRVCRVGIAKRPDLVAKAGRTYVIGEAKFLSIHGGSQGRAFEDGITLASNASGNAVKVFLLDGIHWIETGSAQYNRIDNSTANIFSSLLLEDFLNGL